MQVCLCHAGKAECSPTPSSPGSAKPAQLAPKEPASASSKPPTWDELPPRRRRRLVAVLGTLVQRTQLERNDDEPGQ
jgi:hypothetical protein